jgi:cytochrome bd-type quinol oxidase subunit 2
MLATLFDVVFGVLAPGFCLIGLRALDRAFDDPGSPQLSFDALCGFIAAQVALLAASRWFAPGLRARWPAPVAGALGLGCAFAVFVAVLLVVTAIESPRSRSDFLVAALSLLPLATAVVFARATWKAWRAAQRQTLALKSALAAAGAAAISAAVFFWPVTSEFFVARALARLDRGDAAALEEAARLLRLAPWSDENELVADWRQRQIDGRDGTLVAQLYERVTGRDIERLPARD